MSQDNTAPAVLDLKQMLQYRDQAVVSRMLVKNSAGNVTLFAFDAGRVQDAAGNDPGREAVRAAWT